MCVDGHGGSRGRDGGSLEVVPDPDGLRGGHIGAARKEVPYWTLVDEAGDPWARLCLLFDDEEVVVRQMRRQFERVAHEILAYRITRRLRDVEVDAEAQVVSVGHDLPLVLELQEITTMARGGRAPAALLREEFDVARIVHSVYPADFELVVVTERALEEDMVRCSRGRDLVFAA